MTGSSSKTQWQPPVWQTPDGQPVSCIEKIKVLNDNLEEIRQMTQDALEAVSYTHLTLPTNREV